MKTKSLSLMFAGILAVILLAGLTSAGVLTLTSPDTLPTTINPGEQITINLEVEYIGTSDTITLTWDGTPTNYWTSPVLNSINKDQKLTTTAKFKVPEYTSGTINAELTVSGTGGSSDTLDMPLQVNEVPKLSVSDAAFTGGATTTVTVKNEGNTQLTNIALTTAGSFTVSLSQTTITSLDAGASTTITVTATEEVEGPGTQSVTITAASGSTTANGKVSIVKDYCEVENDGDLKLTIEDIVVKNTGFGDDEEWYPLDEIEVEIDVDTGKYDVDNIEIEWGLYNKETGEWYIDDNEKDFNLKDGKTETITISFKLDDNIDELEDGDFVFYARATGEVDSKDENDKKSTCESDSEVIDVVVEKDFAVLYDIGDLGEVQCGAEIQITADVYNIGSADQDDVLVTLISSDLGIDESVLIDSIDALDSEKLDLLVTLPTGLKEKTYNIEAKVYDEDDDIYENDNDDKSTFIIPVKVSGGCSTTPTTSISASLESGGDAGKDLVVKATITNTGSELVSYTVSAAGYSDWASEIDIDKTTLALAAGASEEVTFTLKVNKDISGEQTFNIEVNNGNELVTRQPVSTSIEAKKGFSFGDLGGDSWYLWGIAALNIILVIIIIIVAVRVAKS